MFLFAPWRSARIVLVAVAIAGLMGAGCQNKSQKSPLPPPTATVSLAYAASTPITGAGGGPAAYAVLPDRDAVAVDITLLELERMPSEAFMPLGTQATFISASRGGSSVLPTARLTIGSRFSPLSDPSEFAAKVPPALTGRITTIQTYHGALFPGTNVRVRLTDDTPVADLLRGRLAKRWCELAVYRPVPSTPSTPLATPATLPPDTQAATPPEISTTENYTLALTLEDLVKVNAAGRRSGTATAVTIETATPRHDKQPSLRQPGKRSAKAEASSTPPAGGGFGLAGGEAHRPVEQPIGLQRELARLNLPLSEPQATYAILMPFAFSETSAQALAILVEIHRQPSQTAEYQATLASLRADLHATQPGISLAATSDRPSSGGAWAGINVAMQGLGNPVQRRAVILYLCTQTQTTLCQHVALVADDTVLTQLATALQKAAPPPTPTPATDSAMLRDLGWRIDQAAFNLLTQLLTQIQTQPRGRMPEELAACLVAFAGEPGRHADSLEEIARGLKSREDLLNRLVQENTIYLEDSSPSARVRAYDWLMQRQPPRAPTGYDPLASPAARHLALDRAQNAATAPAP